MNAILVIAYVLVADPSLALVKRVTFDSRFVCEIEEGRLNKPLTRGYYPAEDNGLSEIHGLTVRFAGAQCIDGTMPSE